jgi:YD repeat-containing protein
LQIPPAVAPGEDLPVEWHISGWTDLAGTGEFELILLFTPGFDPSGAAVPPDYIYPGAELRIPVTGPDGTVTFRVTGDDQEPFRLLAGLLRVSDGELISTASALLPDPRHPQPVPESGPGLLPVGWSGEASGWFEYEWSDMAGKMSWYGPYSGGPGQASRAHIDFTYGGVPDGSVIEVCSRGGVPSASDLAPALARARPSVGPEALFTFDDWNCVRQTLELSSAGFIQIGHFDSAEGRHLDPDSGSPLEDAASYTWDVWVKSLGSVAFPEPSAVASATRAGAAKVASIFRRPEVQGGGVTVAQSWAEGPHPWVNFEGFSTNCPVGEVLPGEWGICQASWTIYNDSPFRLYGWAGYDLALAPTPSTAPIWYTSLTELCRVGTFNAEVDCLMEPVQKGVPPANNNPVFKATHWADLSPWQRIPMSKTIFWTLDPNIHWAELRSFLSSCKNGEDCGLANPFKAVGFAADPINTYSGGFDVQPEDLSVPTSAGPLTFQRSYASLATQTYTAPLGFGWAHNQDVRLIFPDDPGGQRGVVWFKAHTANQYAFLDNRNGTYTATPGVVAGLTRQAGPPVTYRVTTSDSTVYLFDENGRLLTHSDPQGRTLSYTYDGAGRVSQVSADAGARYLGFTYDASGRLAAVADHTGRTVMFGYNLSADLASVVDVLGGTWTYSYDGSHHLTQVTDPRGTIVLRVEYDASGRAVRQFDGLGNRVVEITYNPDGAASIVDARANATIHTYDDRRTLTSVTDTAGGATAKAYAGNFQPSSITDVDGDTTQLTWSANGANLTQVLDAEGNQTDLTYDALNNLTSVSDPAGNVTTYTYSGTLLTSATDALGNTTTYSYTPEGFLASVTDARGNTTSYNYDSFGQRISMTDAIGNTWTYAYNALGRLIDTTEPNGRVTHSEFDAGGRMTRSVRNFDASRPQNDENDFNIVTEYAYDAVGNQIVVTDTFGLTTTYEYDDANRLVRTTDPGGNVTNNTYDAAGNLIATTDALGRTTTYAYDELNRQVSTTDALGNTTSTAYNPDGTVAASTDALGRSTSYAYDDLKRVTVTTDALGGDTMTAYDAAGNVAATTDAQGRTTAYEYDALNRLVRQIDPLGGVTQHFYDAAGNSIRTTDARGNSTTYTYDALNRQVSATDSLGGTATYAYDAVGNRTSVTDARGNSTTFTYDTLDRLVATTDPLGAVTSTAYDALGAPSSGRTPTGTPPSSSTTPSTAWCVRRTRSAARQPLPTTPPATRPR